MNHKIKGNAYWMTAEISVESNAVAGFKLAQKNDGGTETIIGYDAVNHQVYVDRTHSGGKINENRIRQTIDVPSGNKTVKLEILLDKSSLEIFVNDGATALTTYIYPDEDADGISAFATNSKASIKSLQIRDLSGVGKE